MADLGITQGDLVPPIEVTLLAPGGREVQDLTGNTGVVFQFQRADLTGPVLGGAATVVGDPADGVVRYDWAPGDTDSPGQYVGQFRVTFAGDKPGSWPRPKITIEIEPRLISAP
jgi:hypothetical protein